MPVEALKRLFTPIAKANETIAKYVNDEAFALELGILLHERIAAVTSSLSVSTAGLHGHSGTFGGAIPSKRQPATPVPSETQRSTATSSFQVAGTDQPPARSRCIIS